jgi:NAD(P)-dependent dehydrogenase (short-subunit alcohol dehydrogenase family)
MVPPRTLVTHKECIAGAIVGDAACHEFYACRSLNRWNYGNVSDIDRARPRQPEERARRCGRQRMVLRRNSGQIAWATSSFVNRIAKLIKDGGRLVNLSSSGHRFSNVNLKDPNFETTPYGSFVAYGLSKTANILFAVEFDRRHGDRGVRATAVHTGGIMTELGRYMDPAHLEQMVKQINEQAAAAGKGPFKFKTVPQGAATSVWAAIATAAVEFVGRGRQTYPPGCP